MRTFLGALALSSLALAAAPAGAGEAVPAAHPIDLGGVRGVAYYTREGDGLRVVATLATVEGAEPLRVAATLAPAQRIALSVPGAAGTEARSIDILRDGDRILVVPTEIVSN